MKVWILRFIGGVVSLAVTAAACGDLGPVAPDADPAAGVLSGLQQALGVTSERGPATFYCSVAERTRTGQRFRQVEFHLPGRFVPEDGAHGWFVTEKRRHDGEVARRVLCDVPFTTHALNLVARRFMHSLPITSRPLQPGEFGLPDRGGIVRPSQASLLPNLRALITSAGDGTCPEWHWDPELGPICVRFELEGIEVTVCNDDSTDPACWDWDDVLIIFEFENPPPPPPPDYEPTDGGGNPSNPYDDCSGDGGFGDGDGDGDGELGGDGDGDGDCEEDEVVEVDSVTVDCDKSSVVRGGDISCSFDYEPSNANNFQITGWKFQGGGFTRTRSAWPTWEGTVVVGGDVTVEYEVDGSTGTESSSPWSFVVEDRDWLIPVSTPLLGPLTTLGEEPVTNNGADIGGNVSASDPSNQSYAPDGLGQHETTVVSAGPNNGLEYVTSHAYTLARTYWVNRWLKSTWPINDMRDPQTGTMYNRYHAEEVIFGGNGQTVIEQAADHEMHGIRSHQARYGYSVTGGGCGNVAKYIESVVAEPADFDFEFAKAQNDGGKWLDYEVGHRFVYGMVNAYYVLRQAGTPDVPIRVFKQDGQAGDPAPAAACVS